MLERYNKSIWGEKAGSNSYYMDKILDIYPQARILHIVRDPRDACCSVKKRSGSFYHAAAHWLYNNAAAIRYQELPNYYRIKYDDLVLNTKQAVKNLCTWLNIEFENNLVDNKPNKYWETCADYNMHQSWNVKPSDGISSKSIGKYKNELNESHHFLLNRIKLTRKGQKKLNLSTKLSLINLASEFGYNIGISNNIKNANCKLYIDGICQYLQRAKKELKFKNTLWRPITTIL